MGNTARERPACEAGARRRDGQGKAQEQAKHDVGVLSPAVSLAQGSSKTNHQEQDVTRVGKGLVFSRQLGTCADPRACLRRYRTLRVEEREGRQFPRHPCDGCRRGPA